MQQFTLNLTKENETTQKIQLSLQKDEKFTIVLKWDGNVDLDSHALLCRNFGAGGKISAFEDILSTYNVKRTIGGQVVGTLDTAPDGSFEIYGGALVHTADVTGGGDQVETLVIDPGKLPPLNGFAYEIPILAMIHPQSSGKKFADVGPATVSIIDANGKTLMTATLSSDFGPFVGIQMGSLIIDATGTHFDQVGVGFNEDFNGVIGYFA